MSSRPEVSLSGGNTITVDGCLDVDTVAACRASGDKLIAGLAGEDSVKVDLTRAQAAGSAVIALLIAWQRCALRAGIDIEIQNAPENLVDIAEACGVEGILPFSP